MFLCFNIVYRNKSIYLSKVYVYFFSEVISNEIATVQTKQTRVFKQDTE